MENLDEPVGLMILARDQVGRLMDIAGRLLMRAVRAMAYMNGSLRTMTNALTIAGRPAPMPIISDMNGVTKV